MTYISPLPCLGPEMEGIHEGLETMSAYIRSSPRDSVISGLSAGHTNTSTEKLAVVSGKGLGEGGGAGIGGRG